MWVVSSDSDSKNEEEEEVQVTKEKQNVIEVREKMIHWGSGMAYWRRIG